MFRKGSLCTIKSAHSALEIVDLKRKKLTGRFILPVSLTLEVVQLSGEWSNAEKLMGVLVTDGYR